MKELKIKVLAAQIVAFTPIGVTFLRNVQSSKEIYLQYNNGSGQTVTAGQVLFTRGTTGQADYLQVKVVSSHTLGASGTITLSVTAYPTITKADESQVIQILGRSATVNINYESAPVIENIVIETGNRTTLALNANHFNTGFISYDSASLAAVMLVGDLTGYTFNNVALTPDKWVTVQELAQGLLKYSAADVDNNYEKIVQFKVKDTNNNISE